MDRQIHPSPPSAEERFSARMAVLTAQFQRELPDRLDTLLQQWQALQKIGSIDALNVLHNSVHNLAGAGSTFGYDELTTRARALDRPLRGLLAQPQPPHIALRVESSAQWVEINSLFAELEAELRRIVAQLAL